jgi:hypothetical protein
VLALNLGHLKSLSGSYCKRCIKYITCVVIFQIFQITYSKYLFIESKLSALMGHSIVLKQNTLNDISLLYDDHSAFPFFR